ncbi:MAG: alkaline phosphatase family protein [Candidatus Bathyarchaeota archaeon]|nr:alkaline phosphatase family protein [Candidatus Bathyarchaeum sp.]
MNKLLIFFIDAFAYDYLEKTNFLSDLNFDVSPLETLLGYSSSIMPSIWSGRYPEETGVWTEFYHHKRKPYTSLKMIGKIPDYYLRNGIKYFFLRLFQKTHNYDQTLLGIPESIEHLFCRNNINYWIFPPVKLSCDSFDKFMKKKNISYDFDFHAYAVPQFLFPSSSQSRISSNVFIRYIATLDACGHLYGPKPRFFKDQLQDIEHLILTSYRMLSKTSDVDLVIFSDHGMTNVTKQYNLLEKLDNFTIKKDYLVFVDSTIARFWFFNVNAKAQIIQILEQCTYGHILNNAEIESYGLRFTDNRYGDLIFVADPGVEFFPSFMRPIRFPFIGTDPKGLHGYTPEHPSTRGVFMYCGNKDLKLSNTMKITDIYQKLKLLIIS